MDKEKVIKGTEICLSGGKPDRCRSCPYHLDGCDRQRMLDTLALLKEQEAVEPEVEMLTEIDRIYRCPKCHKCFFYEKQKYCDKCGQAVKWND